MVVGLTVGQDNPKADSLMRNSGEESSDDAPAAAGGAFAGSHTQISV